VPCDRDLNSSGLTLTLLHFRVLLVDDVKTSFPANDFAIGRTLLEGCASFHDALFISCTGT
jgi:hypothetical protein